MTGIVCLDQEDGLLFNGRRQSRDRVVTEKILSLTAGKTLWVSAYSSRLFPEDAPVCVVEDVLEKLVEFAESKPAGEAVPEVEETERGETAPEVEETEQGETAPESEETFCLVEEAIAPDNAGIDKWLVFRWKRVYPADVFLKFPTDCWEKELIETFAGYSHEEIDLECYRKKGRKDSLEETE